VLKEAIVNLAGYRCGACGQEFSPEGILAEPAGAIALAALRRLIKIGKVNMDEKVVLIVSGFGFKDPDDADRLIDRPVVVDIKDLESVIA
jgi:threonine synthase